MYIAILQPWTDRRFTSYANWQYESYQQKILAGLQTKDMDWAGVYVIVMPDVSQRLVIDAERFVTCGELVSACIPSRQRNFGTWTFADGCLMTHPAFDDGFVASKYLCVKWGQRHYLIRQGELDQFEAAIEDGIEPRTSIEGQFLLRHGDWELAVSGTHEVSEIDCRK